MARLPSTTALSAFEAAARSLSFVQAADELALTPGAISRQIQSLEATLGVTLFRRSHKRVALTQAGRDYLDAVRGPLAELKDATERMMRRGEDEPVSVVAYPTFAIRWFIPRWGRFYDRHPEIDLQLATSLNPVDFTRRAFDLAIRVGEDDDMPPGFRSEPLLDVDLFPVAAPDVAARLARPGDLARATLIHGTPRPQDWARWLTAAGVAGVDPSRGLRFESLNLAMQAAIEGLGVAIAVAAFVQDDLTAGRLVRPFDVVRRSNRPIRLVYPEAKAADRDLVTVRDWLLREAGREAG